MSKIINMAKSFGVVPPQILEPKEKLPEIDPNEQYGPKKVDLVWETLPHLPKNNMDPKFKRTLTMIGVVVGLLLVMMQEFWLILLIASMFFFGYVVSKAEPQKIKYEVSNHGFMVDDKTYYWYEFVRGFFSEKYGKEILILDTKTHLPPRLFVTFLHQDKTKLTGILKERINFLDKEPESIIDKYAAKVADKFDFKIKKS